MGALESQLFCLKGNLGEDIIVGSTQRRVGRFLVDATCMKQKKKQMRYSPALFKSNVFVAFDFCYLWRFNR